MADQNEAGRLKQETALQKLLRRPEIGSFTVMLIIIVALSFASEGKSFNARVEKQYSNYRSIWDNSHWCGSADDSW